jgi:heme-binding NEAT domain protein
MGAALTCNVTHADSLMPAQPLPQQQQQQGQVADPQTAVSLHAVFYGADNMAEGLMEISRMGVLTIAANSSGESTATYIKQPGSTLHSLRMIPFDQYEVRQGADRLSSGSHLKLYRKGCHARDVLARLYIA